jgi:phosphonate transport system ATP-binding protein
MRTLGNVQEGAERAATSGESLFELRGASVGYEGRPVLSDIDLTIRRGERVAVMGRSGAGKSTLIKLLFGQRPDEIALVPQAAALVRTLSVFHNVFMGRLDRRSTLHNLRTLVSPRRDDVDEVGRVLDSVGMRDKLFAAAGTLSGGQGQRASVARALYNGRPIVIGDEPVSALDRVQGDEILSLIRRRHETLVLVMHDIPLALAHADRIVVLERGRKVLDRPSSELTAADLVPYYGG